MKILGTAAALVAYVALTACGGDGSGNVASTPAPAPAPTPTPTPTPAASISDLQSNNVFQSSSTTTDVALSLPDGLVHSTSVSQQALSISYDAQTKTYLLQRGGQDVSLGPADAAPQRYPGETIYSKDKTYLTLVTTPYYGPGPGNRYVGMGYLQQNSTSGAVQQTNFTTFAYGFDTPAAAVPKTGTAHWLSDVFGMFTAPGKELRVVQGAADFDVDFAAGAFRLQGYLDESQVVTPGGTAGALRIQAGGLLSSGSSFSGPLSYQSSNGLLFGTLNGRFYGPAAEEVGASFSAEGSGNVLTGALTGQRSTLAGTSDGITNLTLTNPTSTELMRGGPAAGIYASIDNAGNRYVGTSSAALQVNLTPAGPTSVAFGHQYVVSAQDIVADGRADFLTYQSTIGGRPATISHYKVGSANQELALTYTGFVSWIWPSGMPSGGDAFGVSHGIYGIRTPRDLLTNRTGTATYSGVVYGTGAAAGGAVYALGGTSRFAVDFSAASYTGSLDIVGTSSTGTVTDFGRFTFGSPFGFGELAQTTIVGPSVNAGALNVIQPQFYGPSGQEIGAAFRFELNQSGTSAHTAMAGVALGKAD